MSWQQEKFCSFKLYAVTDVHAKDSRILEKMEWAAKSGADIIQLRSKELTDREFLRLGEKAKRICHAQRVLFFVNDRADLAWALGADGLHLGQEDLPIRAARKLLEKRVLFLGKSTHSLEQALRTAKEPVDYIGVGPVFQTPTKPHYVPVGLKLVHQVAERIRKPFVAIGGINLDNVDQVLRAGASRVAVVRAIFDAKQVSRATQELKGKLEHLCKINY